MKTVLATLMAMCFLPIVCAWVAGYFRHKQLGAIDNKHPRGQSARLTGAGERAVASQANAWEALAVFSAAILAVFIAGVPLADIANLCLVFLALRLSYIGFYLANIDSLRSLVFIAGYGICLYLFYLALTAAAVAA